MNCAVRTSPGLQSERELVDLVRGIAGQVRAPEIGIGDDAAVVKTGDGWQVLTMDTMVEGTHFAISAHTSWRDVGWKAIVSNQSDIAAMGAEPRHALVSLTLEPDMPRTDIEELYRGMREALDAFGGQLVGGDTTVADRVVVCVAMTGSVAGGEAGAGALLRLDSARAGDVIAVSGNLGDARAGLELMRDDRQAGDYGDDELRLIDALNRPTPRIDLCATLQRQGISCATDISDGLLTDLASICIASAVYATIDVAELPISQSLANGFPTEAVSYALTGGEDYELLVVGDADAIDAVNNDHSGRELPQLKVVGAVQSEGSRDESVSFGTRIQIVGEVSPGVIDGLRSGGWDHLRPH